MIEPTRCRGDPRTIMIKILKCTTVISRWTVHLHQPTTNDQCASQRLTTGSYNKLVPRKTGSFRLIEVLQMTITIEEDGTRNIVSITKLPGTIKKVRRATNLIQARRTSPKTRRQSVHWRGKTTAEQFADSQRECAVDRLVHHVGGGDDIPYAVCWYWIIPAVDTVELPEPIPKNFNYSLWTWNEEDWRFATLTKTGKRQQKMEGMGVIDIDWRQQCWEQNVK